MSSASRLKASRRLLESLFSPVVVVEASGDDAPVEPLHPLEASFVRDAVPRRRREFAMGRACARRALARLGIENRPLLPGHDRAPVWPRGIVGSISHCEGFCAVAVARRDRTSSIGLDVELRVPLDVGLVQTICTPGERVALRIGFPGLEHQACARGHHDIHVRPLPPASKHLSSDSSAAPAFP